MTYNEIVKEVAKETKLTQRFVDRVYKAYWKAIREHVSSLPLKDDLTEEELNALQPNINLPSLGKLCVTKEKYKKEKRKYIKKQERYAAYTKDKTVE